MIGHTTSNYSTKINICKLINGDKLIEFLKDKRTFKPIKNDQIDNIYRFVIDWTRLKYLRC